MRIALVVVIALTVALAASVAQAGDDAATRRATLKLVDTAPLTVRGTGFLARERVRVTVSGQMARTKRVIASARGSFIVTFAGVMVDRCHGLTAVAVGAQGSRAALKLPQPQCPPPL